MLRKRLLIPLILSLVTFGLVVACNSSTPTSQTNPSPAENAATAIIEALPFNISLCTGFIELTHCKNLSLSMKNNRLIILIITCLRVTTRAKDDTLLLQPLF